MFAVLAGPAIGVGVHCALTPNFGVPATPLAPPGEFAAEDQASKAAAGSPQGRRRVAEVRQGCPHAPPGRLVALVDSFPEWPNDVLSIVACRSIRPGLTTEQLQASWGPPQHVLPDPVALTAEHWEYAGRPSVLVWDGLVRSWQ